jgi:hypothetical protein
MRASLGRVDVVGEGVDAVVVGLVVLERDVDLYRNGPPVGRELPLSGQVDRGPVEWISRPVQVLHEGDDSALVAEVVRLPAALVGDLDADARIQERQLSQPL